ncbi:unnamed protein product [Pocillopora meandrina]|uniref:Uncharacterized protein n=1 Tax=Pocillopora meandrina TaxID=46732 RepID=A0AAU9VSC0_9CNID|nr:unnamed protein product [Pocillopora meandrina]
MNPMLDKQGGIIRTRKKIVELASETYIWPFQNKLLNNILLTNTKLFKIGRSVPLAQFTKNTYSNEHLFYDCSYVRVFWKRFCNWWSNILSENLSLSVKDVIVVNYVYGIVEETNQSQSSICFYTN